MALITSPEPYKDTMITMPDDTSFTPSSELKVRHPLLDQEDLDSYVSNRRSIEVNTESKITLATSVDAKKVRKLGYLNPKHTKSTSKPLLKELSKQTLLSQKDN